MHSNSVSDARTGIQPQYQQETDEGIVLDKGIHLAPLVLNFPALDQERVRTVVVSHVDQEIGDPGCFELFDRSINIKLELVKVSCERANKHLAARRNAIRWKRRSSGNTHDTRLISRQDE